MPPRSKKSRTTERDSNQPSLLSFWGKVTPKSSIKPKTKTDTSLCVSAKPSVSPLQNVENSPTLKPKKRRISLDEDIDEREGKIRQQGQDGRVSPKPNMTLETTPSTLQASVTPQAADSNIIASSPCNESFTTSSDLYSREKERHAVSPDMNNNDAQSSTPVAPSRNNHQPTTPDGNDNNGSENDEEDDDDEPVDSVAVSSEAPRQTDDDNNPQGLSEYELLRLRNIARNNARLEALGLLNPMAASQKAKPAVKRPAKKRPNNHKSFKSQQSDLLGPKRRSTRLAKPKSEVVPHAEAMNHWEASVTNKETKAEAVEEETYEVSPLVQYEMSTNDCSPPSFAARNENYEPDESFPTANNNMTSLSPTGQRLAAPQGLSAIYSLNFCPKGTWLVGAGKAGVVALWNTRIPSTRRQHQDSIMEEEVRDKKDDINLIDPIFSWKAHNGRWISEAQFLDYNKNYDSNNNTHESTATPSFERGASTSTTAPSRLVTAANDGTVCLWDLSKVSTATGTPKIMQRSDKLWHSSGIFAMDTSQCTGGSTDYSIKIATGSKDKTVAITSDLETFHPLWRSCVHTAKVGSVKFRDDHVLASASDDGCVAILDDRMKGENASPAALLQGLHNGRPHSVVWDHHNHGGSGLTASVFLTAGLDHVIQVWDSRYIAKSSDGKLCPVAEYFGHVPTSTQRCKRIHHPVFFRPFGHRKKTSDCFVLTGGEGSHSLSLFGVNHNATSGLSAVEKVKPYRSAVLSRGLLPPDCNHADVGSISVHENRVAASVEGEILLLKPSV